MITKGVLSRLHLPVAAAPVPYVGPSRSATAHPCAAASAAAPAAAAASPAQPPAAAGQAHTNLLGYAIDGHAYGARTQL
jgi:hypothetical protein